MEWGATAGRILRLRQMQIALTLLVLGEALVVIRVRPLSDFYFPFVWYGFIFFLDGASRLQSGRSLLTVSRPIFLAMIPLSAAFWWLFELFNLAVDNWRYVGAEQYTGLGFAAFASLDFSTVLLAVWGAARVVYLLLPGHDHAVERELPTALLVTVSLLGIGSLVSAVTFPRYAFGLVWGCMALMLDPVNAWLGRPSILRDLWERRWRLPLSFAAGGLFCGVFWEAWNYWSLPKWTYHVPYVGFLHIFEMPFLGYGGYLPFGLELFVMANFVLPLLRLSTLDLELRPARRPISRPSTPSNAPHGTRMEPEG